MENITVNTQSSIKIEASKVLCFDPFRIEGVLNDADLIFITHNHFDHFSPEDIEKVAKPETLFIVPLTMKSEFLSKVDAPEENCTFVEPGETFEKAGIEIKTVPSYNYTKPFHPKSSKWCGYVVNIDNTKYYIAGDTDGIEENTSIEAEIAFVPIGGTYTMDVKEAVEYICKLEPKAVIPIHYGSIVGNPSDGESFKNQVEQKTAGIKVELKLFN